MSVGGGLERGLGRRSHIAVVVQRRPRTDQVDDHVALEQSQTALPSRSAPFESRVSDS